eukprot:5129430-Alexandrium_andersonii.AAC.1
MVPNSAFLQCQLQVIVAAMSEVAYVIHVQRQLLLAIVQATHLSRTLIGRQCKEGPLRPVRPGLRHRRHMERQQTIVRCACPDL